MFPFEADRGRLARDRDIYIDGFIASVQSFFELLPRGEDFVEFDRFEAAYRVLAERTQEFRNFAVISVLSAVRVDPFVLVIVRCILGFSPPELASVSSRLTGIPVDQSTARRIDKRAREGKSLFYRTSAATQAQVEGLVRASVQLIEAGVPTVDETIVHRLDKIDTAKGLETVRRAASGGIPYAALLYERYLGRPFATHRDAVSERVGSILEQAVETRLRAFGIPYHKSGVAERFEDMDQAPDFFVPSASEPSAVIEAKLAEDDGTARDKVTRIQHLGELRDQRARRGQNAFEVIACVDGRGFGIRRERVWALLEATHGKLFTLQTVDRLIDSTALKQLVRP